jgi:hypothetical protein
VKLSFKLFAGLASAVGFAFGTQVPTLAQVTPTPRAVPTPNINNVPASALPFFTSANTIVVPRDS